MPGCPGRCGGAKAHITKALLLSILVIHHQTQPLHRATGTQGGALWRMAPLSCLFGCWGGGEAQSEPAESTSEPKTPSESRTHHGDELKRARSSRCVESQIWGSSAGLHGMTARPACPRGS